jgi:hypothetical protein
MGYLSPPHSGRAGGGEAGGGKFLAEERSHLKAVIMSYFYGVKREEREELGRSSVSSISGEGLGGVEGRGRRIQKLRAKRAPNGTVV